MKKGQAALTGFIVTIVLIIIVVSLFYSQFSSLFTKESEFPDIKGDSEHVVNMLITEGFPNEWNSENVKKLGIADNDKISMKRLEEFAKINYSKSKVLLGITYDYIFFLEKDGNRLLIPNLNRDFLGWNGFITDYEGNGGNPFETFFKLIDGKAKNIARKEKLVYLEDEIVGETYAKLVVYTWDPLEFSRNEIECSDKIDNDLNGLVDYPDDIGCLDANDDNESLLSFDMNCRYTSDLCEQDETAIIEMSRRFIVGIFPQHAALVGSGYPNRICCGYRKYINWSIDNNCEFAPVNTYGHAPHVFFRFSQEKNAHLQQGSINTYASKTCIRGAYLKDIDCKYENGCTGGRKCVFSVSGNDNAHVGKCSDYNLELCCKFVD